jgi:hypothetical protein
MKLATMLLLLAASHVFALHTQAHQFSTAYLDVSERDGQPLIVWQAALHDLAQAGLLQGASGNAVSWQQVLNSESQLTAYLSARFLFTADAAPCTLTPLHSANWSLQQLQGEFYLQLALAANCATQQHRQLHYSALFDTEHSHKALLFWRLDNKRQRAVIDAGSAPFPAN